MLGNLCFCGLRYISVILLLSSEDSYDAVDISLRAGSDTGKQIWRRLLMLLAGPHSLLLA